MSVESIWWVVGKERGPWVNGGRRWYTVRVELRLKWGRVSIWKGVRGEEVIRRVNCGAVTGEILVEDVWLGDGRGERKESLAG